jgi:thymidine phosphorylase
VRIDDTIDPTVGFIAQARIGDALDEGAAIGIVYCRDRSSAEEAGKRIQAAYEIGEQSPREIPQLFREVINE